jgi:hypothetical protein
VVVLRLLELVGRVIWAIVVCKVGIEVMRAVNFRLRQLIVGQINTIE